VQIAATNAASTFIKKEWKVMKKKLRCFRDSDVRCVLAGCAQPPTIAREAPVAEKPSEEPAPPRPEIYFLTFQAELQRCTRNSPRLTKRKQA
jgi:hypothetical protein